MFSGEKNAAYLPVEYGGWEKRFHREKKKDIGSRAEAYISN